MRYVDISKLEWNYSETHDCYIGVHSDLPNNDHADVVFALVKPGHVLKPHYHFRPDNGYEAFFFFRGGHIELIEGNGKTSTIENTNPFYIYFISKEIHGIHNMGDEDLIFEVICAPKFSSKEEVFI